jgi:copper chaperone CopZ
MLRRKFIQLVTLASTGVLSSYESIASSPVQTATYRVKGFSCITCATGLDTTLSRQQGVKSCQSTYPDGVVKVCFNPDQVTDERIVAFIADLGFTVIAESRH